MICQLYIPAALPLENLLWSVFGKTWKSILGYIKTGVMHFVTDATAFLVYPG